MISPLKSLDSLMQFGLIRQPCTSMFSFSKLPQLPGLMGLLSDPYTFIDVLTCCGATEPMHTWQRGTYHLALFM
jgi:hypothetical protein